MSDVGKSSSRAAPPTSPRSLLREAVLLLGFSAAFASACSAESRPVNLGREPGSPGFVPDDAGLVDAAGDRAAPLEALCIATQCPAPLATCGKEHKCTTDLSSDVRNCGACGNACPLFPSIDLLPRCAGGKCLYTCSDPDHLDCNGIIDDGCEINRRRDPNNCGTCGRVCDEGVRCIAGSCGCPAGKTDCDGQCVDLKRNPYHCSACGRRCPDWREAGWDEPPRNMFYGCEDAECGHLQCIPGFENCDGDLSNGCEVDLAHDEKNCAHCGKQCAEGQVCGYEIGAIAPACLCNTGLTLCSDGQGSAYQCADLLNDVDNCGACHNFCRYLPNVVPNVISTCDQGRCISKCSPGFGDCDGDPSNGCEVNLSNDASNCGGCGRWCNAAEGQPCIDGVCLMQGCDAGVETR